MSMSSTVEQEVDDMTLVDVAPAIEAREAQEPEAAANDVIAQAMSSQPIAIDVRELKAILEAI